MSGLPGDYHEDANRLARKAWRALARGTGMRLTHDEVRALHLMESNGEWWNSFCPNSPSTVDQS